MISYRIIALLVISYRTVCIPGIYFLYIIHYTQGTTTTTTTVYIFYTYYNIYSISILSLLSLSYRTASNPNHKTTTVVIVQQYNNMILSDVSLQYVRMQYCMIMTMRKPRTCSCSLAPCCLLYLRGHPWPLAFARGAVALFPLR